LATHSVIAEQSFSVEFGTDSRQTAWFAVQTRPRYERKVGFDLQEKGIESFVPLRTVSRRWSDRQKMLQVALFSGYTFVRMVATQDTRVAVLRTNGVVSFVGPRGIGTPIPDSEIEAVQTLLKHHIPFSEHPFLTIGQAVRILGGALDGITGILTKINGDQSLVISVELIQRSVAMRVAGYNIEPVGSVPAPPKNQSNQAASDLYCRLASTSLA
jgi:transcription antitermination factor NusG